MRCVALHVWGPCLAHAVRGTVTCYAHTPRPAVHPPERVIRMWHETLAAVAEELTALKVPGPYLQRPEA